MKYLILIFNFCIPLLIASQIVTTSPAFPTANDDITIYYDATQGSAGLVDVDQVYIHTGIITESGGPGNWMNVQGNWGTDDPNVKMINEGNNIHSISFNIKDYYSVTSGQIVTELGMVFRNVDGSKEGKTADFNDIFTTIYSENSDLLGKFITPSEDNTILEQGEDLEIILAFSQEVELELFDNNELIYSGTGKDFNYLYENLDDGGHNLTYEASTDSESINGSAFVLVANPNKTSNDPDDLKYGITKLSPTSVRLKLYAPFKDFVFAVGDFNDWQPTAEHQMFKSINSTYYWIDIEGLNPSESFSYAYLVDGSIQVADPYSTLVLDEFHDQFIPESIWPGLPDFPEETSGIISYYDMNENEFNWTDENFEPVDQSKLNIYELLLRDFLEDHSFNSLIDTLSYLKDLGINAIELMPVAEFEGNDSWGYNASFHMALDKYYGTPDDFKNLVNTAHEMGIAVIVDVVYNHAFSQNVYARMYWENGKPSAQSPFFNVDPKHPFNVGNDFNHESQATKDYVKQTSEYWLDEYHVDGFRFDLSKGFTQKFSSDNGVMSSYDPSRVDILEDYANFLWDINSEFIVILEHFANNSEESILSEKGMMLWANANHQFSEASLGFHNGNNSNFSSISYKSKGWDSPNAVGYMESHDEERLQFKNELYGNSNGAYSIQDPETGYDRLGMSVAFFFSIPGPKMVWEMGELGYDYSINWCTDGSIDNNCRLTPKPVRWDYYEEQGRADLRLVYKAMMDLRASEELMHTETFALDVAGSTKRIKLTGDDNAYLIGNFDLENKTVPADFAHDGMWYDYFTGDSINVDENLTEIELAPGEYRMYWDKKLNQPQLTLVEEQKIESFSVYPNPSLDGLLRLDENENIELIQIFDLSGGLVYSEKNPGMEIQTNLQSGIYFILTKSGSKSQIGKWIIQ